MLSPMTLLDLKHKALALNPTGRVMPGNEEMVAFEEMVWERILSLCFPLNLAIPYNDSGICKIATREECTQWYMKVPKIAKHDNEYIDIDSRLKEAFVFYFIAFLSLRGNDNNREEFESRADRICLDYSCDVANMGLAKAKMVYEQYSGITGVSFNCVGNTYEVDMCFIDTIIGCMLCGNACTSAGYAKQMTRYKEYLEYQRAVNEGESPSFEIIPSHFASLRALDIALFLYILDHMELLEEYGISAIARVTTLDCELGKLADGEEVDEWVKTVDAQLGAQDRSM